MSSEENKVGYRKPPKHSRFKRGQSGNPKGRPLGSKNFKTDLAEELAEQIVVQESGRTTKITKQRALAKTLIAGALKGNASLTNALLGAIVRFSDPRDQSDAKNSPLSEDERTALAVLEARLFRRPDGALVDKDVDAAPRSKSKRGKS